MYGELRLKKAFYYEIIFFITSSTNIMNKDDVIAVNHNMLLFDNKTLGRSCVAA
jgi:hypothetical protein